VQTPFLHFFVQLLFVYHNSLFSIVTPILFDVRSQAIEQHWVFHFYDPRLPGITFIYIRIYVKLGHVCECTFAKNEDRRGDREGRSFDNALDDVAINRARRRGIRDARWKNVCSLALARLFRLDARPVRHQTSCIDHIIGRRSFRYTR